MKKLYRFEVYSSDDRYLTLDTIQNMVRHFRGFLMNYQMYSDLQISLYIEMKECRLLNFYHQLKKKVKVSKFDLEHFDPHSRATCRVDIVVYFVKATGKLKVNIPEVPG